MKARLVLLSSLLLSAFIVIGSRAMAAGMLMTQDPNVYRTVNGINIRNLWLYDRFHYGVNELQSDFAWCNIRARTAVIQNGIVYVAHSQAKQIIRPGANGNDTVMAAVIYRFDALTGEEMVPLDVTLNGEPYGVFSGVNSIGKDNFGHLWVAPYTSEKTAEVPLYQVDIETGELTWRGNLLKGDVLARTDYVDLVGDITLEQAECNVMTPGSQVPTVYAWHNDQGGDADTWEGFFSGDPYMDFVEMYPESQTQWGYAPACRFVLGEDEDTRYSGENFYIDGFTTVPTLYSSDGTIVDGFGSLSQEEMAADSLLMPKVGTNGIGEFKLGDRNFIVYSIGQYDAPNSCQVNICELGEGMSFSGMQRYWTLPADGQGQSSDSGLRIHPISVEYTTVEGKDAVLVLEYKCYNGMGVYMIGENVEPNTNFIDYLGLRYYVSKYNKSAILVSPVDNSINGSVDIPESFVYNNIQYKVVGIDDSAFSGCDGITSVTIPNSVASIGINAFYGCSELSSLTLTGRGAWNYDIYSYKGLSDIISQLATVNIGKGITSLGDFGFAPDIVNSYATTPPACTSGTFSSYDGELHVPSTSTVAYFTAPYWQNFNNLNNDLTDNIVMSQVEANMAQSSTMTLSAITNPEDANVLWSSSNSSVATVDENGVVTAFDEGECDIIATLESNPAVSASCHITVSYPEFALTLNSQSLEMEIGEDSTLVAIITPDNLGLTATWTTSNGNIATVVNGVVTAIGEGECDITAKVLDKTATCHVKVVFPEITLTLNTDILEMKYGEDTTIVATITPDNFGLTPTWASSDESVATVENGMVTAVGEGECDITATVRDKTATCRVIVDDHVIITLNKDNAIIGVNGILTVYPACTPDDVPVELVVTSSDPSVALVRLINRSNAPGATLVNFTEKGQALSIFNSMGSPLTKAPVLAGEKAIMIVGVSRGTATITVTTADGKASPATLELRVVDVDGDGTITTVDVTALYNYLLNGDETFIATSDIDGDGIITTTDITILYNILLGN